jgi:mRNA interferase MazF
MEKNFNLWNTKKMEIDRKQDDIPFFKEGEVWWVHLGLNVGFEMNGKGVEFMRPVIVLKKYNQYSFLALPLGTSSKENQYRISVGVVDGKNATANLSQLKNIDSKRLINKAGHIEAEQLKGIKEKTSHINFG